MGSGLGRSAYLNERGLSRCRSLGQRSRDCYALIRTGAGRRRPFVPPQRGPYLASCSCFFLVGIPLVELYLLIQVGSEIGVLPTIGYHPVHRDPGAYLVRVQGFAVLMRVRTCQDQGELPALEVLDGALLLIAGLMLILPGFLTDTLGFLLLIPPLRQHSSGALSVSAPGHRGPGRRRRSSGHRGRLPAANLD